MFFSLFFGPDFFYSPFFSIIFYLQLLLQMYLVYLQELFRLADGVDGVILEAAAFFAEHLHLIPKAHGVVFSVSVLTAAGDHTVLLQLHKDELDNIVYIRIVKVFGNIGNGGVGLGINLCLGLFVHAHHLAQNILLLCKSLLHLILMAEEADIKT